MAAIQKRGKRWRVQIRRDGAPPVSHTFETRADARRWATEQERLVDTRGLAPDIKGLRKVTIDALLERYAAEVTPLKKSAASEIYVIATLRRHRISRETLASLLPHHVALYRDTRLRSVGHSSVRREMALLRHCLGIAKAHWGYPLERNVAAEIKKPSPPPNRTRRLEGLEQRILLKEARKRVWYLAPLIELAVETGMRRGELLAMRWRDFNRSQRWVYLPDTKNGESRYVPLTSRALRVLEEIKEQGRDDIQVFPVSVSAVKSAWKRMKASRYLDDLRFHDLRHEALSSFFEMGLTVPEVQTISGHKDVATLLKYTHPRAAEIAEKLALAPNKENGNTT